MRSPIEQLWTDALWRAPLAPVALAGTVGVVLDRYLEIPLPISLLAAASGLAAWAAVRNGRSLALPVLYLWLSAAAMGAAYHHWHRNVYAANDIGCFAGPDPRPIHLRGVLEEEPVLVWRPRDDGLRSTPTSDPTIAVVRATAIQQHDDWLPVTGRSRLLVDGALHDLHIGDEIDVVGSVNSPRGPANPGENDIASLLRDKRIRAVITVHKTSEGVTLLKEGWPHTIRGWLAVLRARGQRILQESLPGEEGGVAEALLLGEGSTMTSEDWDKYIHTGVIHILAISG